MKEAILYERLGGGRVRCQLCYRTCVILKGKRGYCASRINLDGTLYSLIYGIISVAKPTPIEDKPLLGFHPGSRCLSIGTYGCNFRCKGCQNHKLSWGTDELDALVAAAETLAAQGPDALSEPLPTPNGLQYLTPQEIVDQAVEFDCEGLVD
jgi:pyruvate formate lyase activating enzyme